MLPPDDRTAALRLLVVLLLACGLGLIEPRTSHAQSAPSESASATPADSVQERRSLLRAARAAKSERLRSDDRAALESLLLWVENRRLLQQIGGAAAEQKRFRVGPTGLGSGSGLGLRVMYVPFPLRRSVDVRAQVGATTRGYWRLGGSIGSRFNSLFTYGYSQLQRRGQRTYFLDLQNTTGPDDSQRFDITTWSSGGVLGVQLFPALSLAASSSYIQYSSRIGEGELDFQDQDILDPATSTRYLTVGGHLQFDSRNVRYKQDFGNRFVPTSDNLTDRPLNPDSGTLLSLDFTQFEEVSGVDSDFHQIEAEVQQYASFFNGYHTFALRHRTVFTGPEDAQVPFYQLPYVGGDFTLRGYENFRFRGPPHGLLYNLEYRYKVWHHADMVLFGDAGKVFDDVGEWGFTDLRYSYGTGLRFTTTRSTFFRIGVAFDEERTPRLVLRFSNVF